MGPLVTLIKPADVPEGIDERMFQWLLARVSAVAVIEAV